MSPEEKPVKQPVNEGVSEEQDVLRHLANDSTAPDNMATSIEGLPTPKASSSLKKRLIALIIAIVALIVGMGVLVYYLVQPVKISDRDADTTAQRKDTAKPKADTTLTAAGLVKDLKLSVGGEDVIDATTPKIKPDGYGFYVNIYREKNSYGTKVVGSKQQVDTQRALLRTRLKQKGFTETVYQESSDDANFAADYKTKNVACLVSGFTPLNTSGVDANKYEVTLGCADISVYQSVAKKANLFAQAYASESKQDIATMSFSTPTVTKSSVAGYSRAEIAISGAEYSAVGGFAGLFYQTPDTLWHFFVGTQNILLCSQYNTPDIKKAYVGEKCMSSDGQQESTVSL